MANFLIVDNALPVRRLLERLLHEQGHDCVLAATGAEAMQHLDRRQFDLMLCDVELPAESGIDLVYHVSRACPETGVIVVTRNDDPTVASTALQLGVYGYVIKPFGNNEIVIAIASALRRKVLEDEYRAQRRSLEQTIAQRTESLRQTTARLTGYEHQMRVTRSETIRRMARLLEYRVPGTDGRGERVGAYAEQLGRRLGLPIERCSAIRSASALHDIGMVAVSDSTLHKPGKLSPDERAEVNRHPEIGYRMLAGTEDQLLELAATVAKSHHEQFDGSGYPEGLKGDEIPLEARIVAIVDTFEALTSPRPYRDSHSVSEAIGLMRERSGSQFDPEMLEVFVTWVLEGPALLREHLAAAGAEPVAEASVADDAEASAPPDADGVADAA